MRFGIRIALRPTEQWNPKPTAGTYVDVERESSVELRQTGHVDMRNDA